MAKRARSEKKYLKKLKEKQKKKKKQSKAEVSEDEEIEGNIKSVENKCLRQSQETDVILISLKILREINMSIKFTLFL